MLLIFLNNTEFEKEIFFMLGGVIKEQSFGVSFNEVWQGKPLGDLKAELADMFGDLLQIGFEDFEEGDIGRVYINHPALEKPAVIPPRPLNEINPEIIMDAVENVLQSEENLNVMEGFDVQLGVARIERGGTNGNPIINVQDARFSKRAMVSINNDDNLCLARALAVGIAKNNVEKANDGEKANAEKIYRNI